MSFATTKNSRARNRQEQQSTGMTWLDRHSKVLSINQNTLLSLLLARFLPPLVFFGGNFVSLFNRGSVVRQHCHANSFFFCFWCSVFYYDHDLCSCSSRLSPVFPYQTPHSPRHSSHSGPPSSPHPHSRSHGASRLIPSSRPSGPSGTG